MSLYNLLHGRNALSELLLSYLRLTPAMIPRFRDCYIDGERIIVFTRTGGGNRNFYENERRCRASYPHYFEPESPDPPSGPWNDDLRHHE